MDSFTIQRPLLLYLLAQSLASTAIAHSADPNVAPHVGEVKFFTSTSRVIVSFMWHDIPDDTWVSRRPAFELDIKVPNGFFESCTSWSDLPNFYDDCDTAGVSDPGGEKVFGVGSFSAREIQPNKWYHAVFNFIPTPSKRRLPRVDYEIIASEVTPKPLCPLGHWCMYEVGNPESVAHGTLERKGDHLRYWHFTGYRLLRTLSKHNEPDGQSYESAAGIHFGKLRGPLPEQANFNLCLFKWIGGDWKLVASSDGPGSRDELTYVGQPGIYIWVVYSENGGGWYNLYIEHP